MAETEETPPPFDGIVDNKIPGMPMSAWVLFLGLTAVGLIYIGLYLFGDWSSAGEFEEKLKAHQASIRP